MHRLTRSVSLSLLLALAACSASVAACGGRPPAATASAKGGDGNGDGGANETGEDAEGEAPAGRKDECLGFDIASLDDVLLKSGCEVPNAKPESVPEADLKGKLEVTVSSSPTRVAPGQKADLLVTFANKTKEPLTLHFRIDPMARFEVETYDKKGKRLDMPAGSPPPAPANHNPPPAADPKVAKVTLAPNGSARQKLTWAAARMTWAPEKVRGTPVERGFPRKPAGPLPKGKYTVKVVTPLVGVADAPEHALTAPQVEIEIGG